MLSLLTQQMGYVLRVDMEVFSDGSPHQAMYDCFYVEGNSSNYTLRVGTFDTHNSDAGRLLLGFVRIHLNSNLVCCTCDFNLLIVGDSMRPHGGMMFSTRDAQQ